MESQGYLSDSFLTACFVRGEEDHHHVRHTKDRKRGEIWLKEEISPRKDDQEPIDFFILFLG